MLSTHDTQDHECVNDTHPNRITIQLTGKNADRFRSLSKALNIESLPALVAIGVSILEGISQNKIKHFDKKKIRDVANRISAEENVR